MKATHRLLLQRSASALRPSERTRFQPPSILLPQASKGSRNLVSNLLTPLQSLTASRILPYHAAPLYNIIADIQSYPQFIPYCISSSITSTSAPEATTEQRWPRTADLRIGYGPYDEVFRSAVYCLPHRVLEAVAGDAVPTIPRSQLPHYYEASDQDPEAEKSAGNTSMFTSLLTRWTFREFPFKPPPPDGSSLQEGSASTPSRPRTEVNLALEVRFSNAVYSALSQAVAPRVAGMMIDAVEKRVKELLGQGTGHESMAEIDGKRGAMEGVSRG